MDHFELRTAVAPESIAGTVRRMVRDVLKTVPVTSVTTLADQVDSNIVPERLIATLSEFFGCLGVVLAGIGLYGLLAYTVARRTNEIGIRMALGATAGQCKRTGAAGRSGDGVRGLGCGNGDGPLEQTAGGQSSLGFEMGERCAAGDRRRGDDRGGTTRLLCTGAAGGPCGPDGGASARVGWRKPAHRQAAVRQSPEANN